MACSLTQLWLVDNCTSLILIARCCIEPNSGSILNLLSISVNMCSLHLLFLDWFIYSLDSLDWFIYSLDWFISLYGVSGWFKLLPCFIAILILNANSVDPDQTPHSAFTL